MSPAGRSSADAQRRFRHRADQLEAAAQDFRERLGIAVLRPLELRGALDGDPEPVVVHHAPLVPQLRELRLPRLDLGRSQEAVHHERIVQLVVRTDLRPGLRFHLRDRGGIEAAEIGGVLRVEQAIGRDGARAAPLGIAVVEEGVGPRAEHGVRERRGRREVEALHIQRAVLEPPQQREEAVDVHELAQAIVDRLLHERVVGNLARAGQVLRAGDLVGEHDGQEVLGVRALERRGHALAVPVPDEGERDGGVPAPARARTPARRAKLARERLQRSRT